MLLIFCAPIKELEKYFEEALFVDDKLVLFLLRVESVYLTWFTRFSEDRNLSVN